MKIAIPANEKDINTEVSASFGRAPYYLIHDTQSGENTFIENTAAQAAGGAGIKAAQLVVDSGAKVALSPRLGQNAADVLKNSGVEIYKSNDKSLKDNIEDFAAGKLSLLDQFHAGFHGHGG
ncbi:MAG: dinitrogenase iron-molybdenum cofactor biosynthesis protein [Clostridiales bacterium]|nr:dinitrogenase iron-molybdenum cofactor biosynthesis protein [Clostridiales bacterium]